MKRKKILGMLMLCSTLMLGCSNVVNSNDEIEVIGKSETENAEHAEAVSEMQENKMMEEEQKSMNDAIKTLEMMVSANDREIFVKGYVPDDDKKHPAVVVSHGYNGSHADLVTECEYFARNGFCVYALDFCGGSVRSKSSGNSTDMTIFTEKEDLLAVFDYVSTLDEVDTGNMYLFGGSQGGFVTCLAAEEIGNKIKGIALYYPALNIPDDWRKNYKTEEEIPETVNFWGLELGKNFFTSIRDFYSFEHIGGFTKKILIIHGDKDTTVPLSTVEKAADIYTNAELVILPGEGHGFSPDGVKTSMEKILKFMQE